MAIITVSLIILFLRFQSIFCQSPPANCTSPDGKTCNWYSSCENVYGPRNCTGRENYAINYGEKYCKKYNLTYNWFSLKGQVWIDKIRKCLQVALVPTLGAGLTCEQVKQVAFKSHPGCYVNNGLCDLPFTDWLKILYTVRQAFGDEFVETLTSALQSISRCVT